MYLDNYCIEDIDDPNQSNIFKDLDYEFKKWEKIEKQHKNYLQYINNLERSIVPYEDYNSFKLIVICFNILHICLINFVVIPSKIIMISENK